MPAGGPNDHPLTDILIYKLPVYNDEADELIRKIRTLSSTRELDEWWEKEIGWTATPELALTRSKARYAELLKRAKASGWEIQDQQ
jgi:hypothetical protein